MRKIFITIVILCLFFSCNNDTMENVTNKQNPFIGTWENENVHYVFTENLITITIKSNGNLLWNATPYTFDNIHIVIYNDERATTIHYLFKNDKLILSGDTISAILGKTN